jgi:hypothetical protein
MAGVLQNRELRKLSTFFILQGIDSMIHVKFHNSVGSVYKAVNLMGDAPKSALGSMWPSIRRIICNRALSPRKLIGWPFPLIPSTKYFLAVTQAGAFLGSVSFKPPTNILSGRASNTLVDRYPLLA